jgi:hypothetical protein
MLLLKYSQTQSNRRELQVSGEAGICGPTQEGEQGNNTDEVRKYEFTEIYFQTEYKTLREETREVGRTPRIYTKSSRNKSKDKDNDKGKHITLTWGATRAITITRAQPSGCAYMTV